MDDHELQVVLRSFDLKPRRNGNGWVSLCPAHDDRTPSLSSCIAPNGRLLLYCHAGCPFLAIMASLGLRGSGTYRSASRSEPRPIRAPSPPSDDVARVWRAIRSETHPGEPDAHEHGLGIPLGGLARIGVAWASGFTALAAPMLDGIGGNLIGVRLRADDGKKWAVAGSRNGLFVPREFVGSGPLYFPEGMTDTAAMVGLGLDAIGRPSCNGGRDLVRMVVKQTGRPSVIVTDADKPGREGAALLASELVADGAKSVKVIAPPPGFKDVREFVRNGADRSDFAFIERNTSTWKRQ